MPLQEHNPMGRTTSATKCSPGSSTPLQKAAPSQPGKEAQQDPAVPQHTASGWKCGWLTVFTFMSINSLTNPVEGYEDDEDESGTSF